MIGQGVPAFVPAGFNTHADFVLSEAVECFERGDHKAGTANLAHAVVVVARDGFSEEQARVWFRRVTAAAKAWEQEL